MGVQLLERRRCLRRLQAGWLSLNAGAAYGATPSPPVRARTSFSSGTGVSPALTTTERTRAMPRAGSTHVSVLLPSLSTRSPPSAAAPQPSRSGVVKVPAADRSAAEYLKPVGPCGAGGERPRAGRGARAGAHETACCTAACWRAYAGVGHGRPADTLDFCRRAEGVAATI